MVAKGKQQPSYRSTVMGDRKIVIQDVTFQECESGGIPGVKVSTIFENSWIWPVHLLRNIVHDALEMMSRKEAYNGIEETFSYHGTPIAKVDHHGVSFKAGLSMPVLVNHNLTMLQEFCDTVAKEWVAHRVEKEAV